jgi:hypothetical protein
VVPSDLNRLGWVFVQQGLEQLGHFRPTLMLANEHERLASMVVDVTHTIALVGLLGRVNHDLLSNRTPHRPQGW